METKKYGFCRIKWEDYNYISAIFSKGGLSVGEETRVSFEDAIEVNKLLSEITDRTQKIDAIFKNAIKEWSCEE